HEGRIEMLGSTMSVLDSYQDYVRLRDSEQAALKRDEALVEGKKLGEETCLREVTLGGDCRDGVIETGGALKIRIVARLAPAAQKEGVHVGIVFVRNDMTICYGVNTKMDELGDAVLYPLQGDEYGISFVLENLSLLAGEYHVSVFLSDLSGLHNYDILNGVIQFKVQQRTKEVGLVRLAHHWEQP
ncbi:MAG: Wzt carbohydrate-binding domain-containing protein, partial [bacterium]